MTIVLLALVAFASACAFRIGDPLLPHLAHDFSVSTASAAHVVTVFGIAYGIAQFFYGPLGDRIGKIRTILIATLLSCIGSLGAAFAPSLDMVVACRALSGMTGAGIMPLALAWIGDNVAYEKRQATMSRVLFGSISGLAGGQFIGGVFADTLGWRYGFAFLGCVFLAAGLALLVFRPKEQVSVAASAAKLGFAASIKELFSVPWARVVLLTGFLEGAIVFGVLAFVPNYMQTHFGVSTTISGLTGIALGVGGFMYVLNAQWLVPRFGERGLVAGSGVVLAVTFLLFLAGPSWPWMWLGGFTCGLGYYLLHSTLQTNATQMAPKVRGTAVSLFASFLFVGQSAGALGVSRIEASVGLPWAFALAMVLMPAVSFGFLYGLSRRAGLLRDAARS